MPGERVGAERAAVPGLPAFDVADPDLLDAGRHLVAAFGVHGLVDAGEDDATGVEVVDGDGAELGPGAEPGGTGRPCHVVQGAGLAQHDDVGDRHLVHADVQAGGPAADPGAQLAVDVAGRVQDERAPGRRRVLRDGRVVEADEQVVVEDRSQQGAGRSVLADLLER